MLTLLHDPNNAASTAFLALYGTSGAVITGHDACVSAFPNIQGFPTVVYQDANGASHFLFNPPDMAAVTAWRAGVDASLVPALAQAQATLCAQIDQAMNAAVYGKFTDSGGNTWPVDQGTRALMTGTAVEIAGGLTLPASFAWPNASGAWVPMTATTFKALCQAVFNWTNNCFVADVAAKQAVNALTTVAAVQAYQIPAWPTS